MSPTTLNQVLKVVNLFTLVFSMCVSPIRIKNPNKGYNMPLYDTVCEYINIPCGRCYQCISTRQNNVVQRVVMESFVSYLYFGTLTYSSLALPRFTSSLGYTYTYASIRDFQNMIKRLRKNYTHLRPFKYLCVSERGRERGRPHFHFILSVPKYDDDDKFTPQTLEIDYYNAFYNEWRRNEGSSRSPIYVPCFEFHKKRVLGRTFKNFDFHYMDDNSLDVDSSTSVGYYVCKYILKGGSKFFKKHPEISKHDDEEIVDIIRLCRDKIIRSHSFGFRSDSGNPILTYLQSCAKRSYDNGNPFPQFFYPFNDKSVPMCRYYKNNLLIIPMDMQLEFRRRLETFGYDPSSTRPSSSLIDAGKRLDFLDSVSKTDDFVDIFDEF